MTTEIENEFLRESNAIEGVYDIGSLWNAISAWNFLKTKKKLTIGAILKVHKIMMLNQPLQPDERGYFRQCEVTIGKRFGLNWVKVPESMHQWVLNVNDLIENGIKESELFKERMTKEQHIKYENIHPFVDGNGRTGRIFYNWTRLKLGMPIYVIREEERLAYYEWFKEQK